MSAPVAHGTAESLVAPGRPTRPVLRHAGGGPPAWRDRPYLVANGVLAMAIFIAAEAMLFAGLISAFLVLRASTASWPPADQPRLPVGVTGVNTAVLLLSAYTMHRAVREGRQRRRGATLRFFVATAALGSIFLLVQGAEWVALLRHGLTASSSIYGATFYTLIGCHGLHVVAAVATLLVVLGTHLRWRSAPATETLEVCRLYWAFVVAVWPVLYVLVYLA